MSILNVSGIQKVYTTRFGGNKVEALKSVMEGYEAKFHLPWTAIGIAVLSVFLVVFITMMYSMSKIKKDNPIDALKNENL